MSSPPKRRSRSRPRKSYQQCLRRPSPSPSEEFAAVQKTLDASILQSFGVAMIAMNYAVDQGAQRVADLTAMFGYIKSHYGTAIATVANPWSWPKGGTVTAHDGFSADELPLTIGSYLGVRYWTAPKNVVHEMPQIPVTIESLDTGTGPHWVPVDLAKTELWLPPKTEHSKVRLKGMQKDWEPGENIAHCGPFGCPDELVPARGCGCGFWAYWQPEEASRHMSNPDVIGVVEGYGHVVAGDKGFRCSRSRVAALCVLKQRSETTLWRNEMMTALHEVYGVPIYDDPETMLRAHPPSRGRVAEWAQARPGDAELARTHQVTFPLGTEPVSPPVSIPCVICGQQGAKGTTCDECAQLATLATRMCVWVKCHQCGTTHEITLEVLDAAHSDVQCMCRCGSVFTVGKPKLTPAQALRELQRRAGNWTVSE